MPTVNRSPDLVYVIGVDGTGKSTLIDGLAATYPHLTTVEATATEEAKRFKAAHYLTPITDDFITTREQLFLGVARRLEESFRQSAAKGEAIVTTGSKLVTSLSHAAMRQLIGAPAKSTEEVVETWAGDETVRRPTGFVHMHAPMEVILSRIQDRLIAGDEKENRHGFNSPDYLEAYQGVWGEAVPLLAELGTRCVSVDTSVSDKVMAVEQAATVLNLVEVTYG